MKQPSMHVPEDILEIFTKGWFFQYTKAHFPVDGLLKLDGLKEIVKNHFAARNCEKSFQNVKINKNW